MIVSVSSVIFPHVQFPGTVWRLQSAVQRWVNTGLYNQSSAVPHGTTVSTADSKHLVSGHLVLTVHSFFYFLYCFSVYLFSLVTLFLLFGQQGWATFCIWNHLVIFFSLTYFFLHACACNCVYVKPCVCLCAGSWKIFLWSLVKLSCLLTCKVWRKWPVGPRSLEILWLGFIGNP